MTVDDFASYGGDWSCTADPPFGCGIDAGQLQFQIHMIPSPKQAVTLGWQLEDITTTAGQDYTGPTSGTVTFPAHGYVTYVYVPVAMDSVAEANETVRFRITSSSIPANITDTAIGTIKDGSQVPVDCTVTQTDYDNMFMTCTGRPPAQHWHLRHSAPTSAAVTSGTATSSPATARRRWTRVAGTPTIRTSSSIRSRMM